MVMLVMVLLTAARLGRFPYSTPQAAVSVMSELIPQAIRNHALRVQLEAIIACLALQSAHCVPQIRLLPILEVLLRLIASEL